METVRVELTAKVVGGPAPTMVIREGETIRAWTWRGSLRLTGVQLACWQDAAGREWRRMSDQSGISFLLGHSSTGWVAMEWPSAPPLRSKRRTPALRKAL
jgi:hypothetical protein